MNQYTEAFAQAMQLTGTRNTSVVSHLGNRVSPTDVSNWRVGRRPIPPEHAPAVAALLNIEPASISAAYERMVLAGLSTSLQSSRTVAGHILWPPGRHCAHRIARISGAAQDRNDADYEYPLDAAAFVGNGTRDQTERPHPVRCDSFAAGTRC
jgi:DNA-binding transcriptional regulator YdaS (Cro superfamily)